jgi:catechol 2,3-dioxygenase-like lactoylglutathione lyase family enzyme
MATVSVRYIVDDVDAALAFYCQHLGFEEQMHPNRAFAMLTRGDIRLLLSAPGGGPGVGRPCRTEPCPHREGGIGSPLKWPIWRAPWTGSARPASMCALS